MMYYCSKDIQNGHIRIQCAAYVLNCTLCFFVLVFFCTLNRNTLLSTRVIKILNRFIACKWIKKLHELITLASLLLLLLLLLLHFHFSFNWFKFGRVLLCESVSVHKYASHECFECILCEYIYITGSTSIHAFDIRYDLQEKIKKITNIGRANNFSR